MNELKKNYYKYYDTDITTYNNDCMTVLPIIPNNSINLILCDLPYGTTVNKWDQIIPLVPLWEQYNRIICDGGAIVLTSSQPFTSVLVSSNIQQFKTEWIWKKALSSGSLNAKKIPMKNHESVLVFAGPSGRTPYFPVMGVGKPYTTKPTTFKGSNYGEQVRPSLVNEGIRYPTSVVEISNPRIKGGHPTQKPVALMEYFINTYSQQGETVLDNCMGSGSTGIACINTHRSFIGIEIDNTYYNSSLTRIEQQIL